MEKYSRFIFPLLKFGVFFGAIGFISTLQTVTPTPKVEESKEQEKARQRNEQLLKEIQERQEEAAQNSFRWDRVRGKPKLKS